MRFERLHFHRYGAFTDRPLHFRSDAKLHIVYGPNEAGKSTALSALSALLFGFPHQTSHDFLHTASTLRLGATIAANDGGSLSFRRRKGNKATLLADDDAETALRDDALAPFLGGLSKDVFEKAFGLDSARLRAGAEAMLKSEGELGGALFAAASGLTGLKDLKARFDDEAGQIYTPRAAKRVFNTLDAEWKAARERARENELRAADWKALNEAIDTLATRHEALKDERAGIAHRREDLALLKRVLPVIETIDADAVKLAAFEDIAALADGFGPRLSEALQAVATSADAAKAAGERVETSETALASVDIDTSLLERAEAITALYARSGAYRKAKEDLPAIARERDGFVDQIAEKCQRLGLTESDIANRRPQDWELMRAQSLAREGETLSAESRNLERRIGEEREALEQLRRAAPSGHLTDPKPLRERLNALDPDLRALAERTNLTDAREAKARRIMEAAARLSPPVADPEALAAAPLPAIADVEAAAIRLRDLDAKIAVAHDRLEETRAALKTRRRDLTETERGGTVPSPEAIQSAREARDARLMPLAESLLGRHAAPSIEEAAAAIDAYRAALAKADQLSDAATRDAARVERHARLTADLAALADEEAERARRLDALGTERDAAEAAFAAPFEALGVAPTTPDRMLTWLRALAKLLDEREERLALDDRLASLARLDAELRPALLGIGEAAGLGTGMNGSTEALARALAARLRDLEERWSESRSNGELIKAAEARIESLGRTDASLAERRAAWRTEFDAALGPIGLKPGGAPEEALATIALWNALPALESERRNRARRVDGMRRDIEDFERDVAALAGPPDQDDAGLSADQIAGDLDRRSRLAAESGAMQRERREALTAAQREREAADRAHAAAEEHLRTLLAECPADADPTALVARLAERDRLRAAVFQCRSRLIDLAPKRNEAEIRAALQAFDPARADLDIADLDAEADRLTRQADEIYAELSKKQDERSALDSAVGAERATFERLAVETEMLDVARRWAVLKIASALVGATLDHQRQNQDAPLMRRAGTHFAQLTRGAYTALSQSFGADDRIELEAVRAGGETVKIADLSDGTRDQLFLALRLAFVEDYAARNEPIPFIGDDIFQTFDDERTAAGLVTLAGISAHAQPILFAHHRSVVTIAKERLKDDVDILEL